MRCWPWLTLLSLILPSSALSADSWAVLVGIADYATPDWRLQSPENDLSLMLDLCDRWGIPAGQKMVLRDGAATKQAVLSALKQTGGKAKSGDTLVFYFSGHGVLVADVFGPERFRFDEARRTPPDTDDEALVAADSKQGDPMSFILDDELAEVLGPIQQRGVKLVCLLDCCFAFDGIRALPEELGALKTVDRAEPAPRDPELMMKAGTPRSVAPPDVLDLNGALLLAAAGPRQSVREVYWRLGGRKAALSAMTLGLWAWADRERGWTGLCTRLGGLHQQCRLSWTPTLQAGASPWLPCSGLEAGTKLLLRDTGGNAFQATSADVSALVR